MKGRYKRTAVAECIVLHCRSCGKAVSKRVRRLPNKNKALPKSFGEDLLARSYYIRKQQLPAGYSQTPERNTVFLNLADVVHTKPGGDRSGCCGAAGLDGINTFCRCGQPLAIECSDCWQSHSIEFPLSNVNVKEVNTPRARKR